MQRLALVLAHREGLSAGRTGRATLETFSTKDVRAGRLYRMVVQNVETDTTLKLFRLLAPVRGGDVLDLEANDCWGRGSSVVVGR